MPVATSEEGNPVEANSSHVPSSTRSCDAAFSRPDTCLRHSQALSEKSVQNPYKSDHFHEVQSFSYSAPTVYNFNTLKGTDSAGHRTSPLPPEEGQSEGQTRSLLPFTFQKLPFSLGDKARMRDKLIRPIGSPTDKELTNTVQNETKRDDYAFSQNQPRCPKDLQRPSLQSSHFVGIWKTELRDALARKSSFVNPNRNSNGCVKTVPFLYHFPGGGFQTVWTVKTR